jgi:DNA-binding HxlR family transcriptional regulator
MRTDHRSACPVNLALEVFGDRWSLLIVRDLMFAGKRHFRQFLSSDESIASNILTDRLNMLVQHGIVTKAEDLSHKQKAVYRLTEKGIALLPIIAQMGIWGRAYCPVTKTSGATAARLEKGGTRLWKRMMSELRRSHLSGRAEDRGER